MSRKLFSKQKAFEDLSGSFQRALLQKDDLARYGIAGDMAHAAFDQVQSLLAIATSQGTIHILGQNGVEVVYHLPAGCTAAHVCLHKSHLTAIDQRNTLYTWLLEDCRDLKPAAVYALRGVVTAIYVEPSVDWLLIGMVDGSIAVWDLEGEQMAAYKIKNLYFERQEEARLMEYDWAVPRYHISPIVCMQIHPLDLGMLLVGYPDGAVLYSFKDGTSKAFFEMTLAADGSRAQKKPALTCATLSPDGAFIVTGYNDGTFAFFCVQEPDLPVQVRSLHETDLNLIRRPFNETSEDQIDPIFDLAWCCRTDPSETFLLVAGGGLTTMRGLALLDFGPVPSKAADQSAFFATPRRQKVFPLDGREPVTQIQLLGTTSPFYLGGHDPQACFLLKADGTAALLSLPAGVPVAAASLPPSLTFACPPCTLFTVSELPRPLYMTMHDHARQANHQRPLLIGGAPAKRRLRTFDKRAVLLSVHGSILRLHDIAHAEMAETALVTLDVSMTLSQGGRLSAISLAGTAGELALATAAGSVLVFKYPARPHPGVDGHAGDTSQLTPLPSPVAAAQAWLFGFETSLAATFNPVCLLQAQQGSVTALAASDVGFVAVGYETGMLCLVDMRGPAVIFAESCERLQSRTEKSFFKRKSASDPLSSQQSGQPESATCFSWLTMGIEARLAVTLAIGTSRGRTLVLELLKDAQGMFSAVLHHAEAGNIQDGAVVAIRGCLATGEDLVAQPEHLAMLQEDTTLPECFLIVFERGIRSLTGGFKTSLGKAELRQAPARAASLLIIPGTPNMVVLAVSCGTNQVELFSIPGLRPLGSVTTPEPTGTTMQPSLTAGADLICQSATGGTELALLNLLGTGVTLRDVPPDALFDALKQPTLARPTISNWQWISGTQHIKPTDLDLIISGGVRPLSKRAQERIRASEKQQQLLARQQQQQQQQDINAGGQGARTRTAQRGAYGKSSTGRDTYGEMQQQGQERGERVSQLDETFENLSKASGDFLNEVDKFAANAKKQVLMGGAKRMFGF